jgi:putative ABC transport system permease protein
VIDLLLSTLRSLRAHALRFFLTSLGIVWGAFLLTYLTASMEGLDDHFTRELEEAGPKLVIAWPGAVLKNRVAQRGARNVVLEDDDVERMQLLHSVESAAPDLDLWSQIVRAGGRTKLFRVNGVDARSQAIRNLEPREGRFISQLDVERRARVAYLGAVAAERLFGSRSPVGRTLQIESIRFRVIGVGQPKGDQMIGVKGWDDWKVFVPYTAAQRWLLKHDRVGEIAFAPLTREGSWDAIRHVREIVGLHHDFPPDLDTALSFFNVHEILQIIHRLFVGFRIFLVTAGLVTLLVGGIGVMNIMLVVVGERTNEIGLRKAVGAPSRSIFLQFLAEATAVCGLSGLLGAGLGVGFTRVVTALTPPDGPFSSAPILSPFIVAVIVSSLAAVGIVAGVVPAARAARIPPAEALRASAG